MFDDLYSKPPYRVILADPPWSFKTFSDKGLGKSPQQHYGCMTLDDIINMPVDQLADPAGCVLILWATAPMMPQALTTMLAWGFGYKTMGAWAKQSSTGKKWSFGTGFVYRSAAEFWLYGTIGKPKQKVRNVRNLVVAPVREHSRKPEQMRRNIEALWDGPYLELFSRETACGWDSWGNETSKFPVAELQHSV